MQSVTSNGVANALGYLVWENPDSTQNMGAESKDFDRAIPSGYTKLKIEYRNITSESFYFVKEVSIGNNTYLDASYAVTSGNAIVTNRLCYLSNTGFTVTLARRWHSSTGYSEVENRCIPTRIWAIK